MLVASLVGAIVTFVVIGYLVNPDRASDITITKYTKLLPLSLAAANLSIAGTIFAVPSAAGIYGFYTFVLIFTSVIGMWAFVLVYWRLHGIGEGQHRFTVDRMDSHIEDRQPGSSLRFSRIFALSIGLIYLLVAGWELYVGSTAVSFIISSKTDWEDIFQIAALLAAGIAVYAYRSRFDRVVFTDAFQLVAGVIFIGLIAWNQISAIENFDILNILSLDNPTFLPNSSLTAFEILVFCLSLSVMNLFSQVQSPSNWQVGKSYEKTSQLSLGMLIASVILSAIWITVVILAFSKIALPENVKLPQDWLRWVYTDNILFKVVFIVGIVGFVMSTVDSMVMGVLNLIKDAYKKDEASKTTWDGAPWLQRTFAPIFLIVSFSFAVIMMTFTPNIFYSLMTIAGSAAIYFGTFAYLIIGRQNWLSRKSDRYRLIFYVFFGLTAASFVLNMAGYGSFGFAVVMTAFVLGFILPLAGGQQIKNA